MRHLTDLTMNNSPFIWSHLCEVSFDTIRIALTNSPILTFLDPNEEYVFYTDDSKHSWS